MTRKLRAVVAVVAVTAAIAIVVVSGADDGTPVPESGPASTASVERGSLSTLVSRAGFLTYRAGSDGAPLAAINRASGTYTSLPAAGGSVDCGEVLYRVDERPVLLLCGAVPAYRDLRLGDVGDDVRQLNQNLHHLGHDAGSDVDPNSPVFTEGTQAALRELQQTTGADVTGTLGVGETVFLPWSVHVAAVTAELGGIAQPGAEILRATSNTLEVQVELDASEREAVQPGDVARITLPGNTSATGTVDRLGTIVEAPSGPDADIGAATIGAYISLDRPEDARGLDKAPVQVEIATVGVEDALSVPVTAIFGHSGGGYAVEVVRDGGRRELVAVELSVFDTAGGRVQVDGDVREGDHVVVPSP